MSEPRDYEIPFLPLEPVTFDMMADLGLDVAPSDWLLVSASSDQRAAVDALIKSLEKQDRQLGGRGLIIDPKRSTRDNGHLRLVLRPLQPQQAAERLRRLAADNQRPGIEIQFNTKAA